MISGIEADGGGGGNRTRVRRCFSLNFYVRSSGSQSRQGERPERFLLAQPARFSIEGRQALPSIQPANPASRRPCGPRAHPERAALFFRPPERKRIRRHLFFSHLIYEAVGTSARRLGLHTPVEPYSPPTLSKNYSNYIINPFFWLSNYRILPLKRRRSSRSSSRRLMVSRRSWSFFPFARASSTLAQPSLK